MATAYLGVLLTCLDTPLWLDEAWVIEDLLGTPLLLPGQSVREAAYEWLLQAWMLVAGASIASLRLLMIGFSLVTVWALVRAAHPAEARPGAALLVFTSFPVIVHFAVEINRYAELALGATLSLWACLELARRRAGGRGRGVLPHPQHLGGDPAGRDRGGPRLASAVRPRRGAPGAGRGVRGRPRGATAPGPPGRPRAPGASRGVQQGARGLPRPRLLRADPEQPGARPARGRRGRDEPAPGDRPESWSCWRW